VTVTGHGNVTSTPAGISCGADCAEQYGSGTVVTLTEAPGFSAIFDGWGGACSGHATTCTVTMDQARSVTAGFVDVSQLTIRVSNTHDVGIFTPVYGTNGVRKDGATVCQMSGRGSHDCQIQVLADQPITLTASAGPDDSFYQWNGFCSFSTATTCTFTPHFSTESITATFSNS
jgi:hypothetical protein